MTLKEYLTKNKISFRSFSKVVNIDQAQLNRYANGIQQPSLGNAYKIYKATKKKIKLEDWFADNK